MHNNATVPIVKINGSTPPASTGGPKHPGVSGGDSLEAASGPASASEFAWLTFGVFACYSIYGMLQEVLLKQLDGFNFGLFLTLFQFILYAIISWARLTNSRTSDERKGTIRQYLIIAFLSVSTMGLSNKSVQFLNYPTQVLFKSCKLIPVMIVSVLYLKKKYRGLDYVAMCILTIGLVMCTVGDKLGSTKFDNSTGVILILLALLADAFIGNVQEKVMRERGASTNELMFYSKSFGIVYLFIACLLVGELFPAIKFCMQTPIAWIYMTIFSLVGCVGEFFVMQLVKRFDALVAIVTTSCRKVFSIFLSFILFPKPGLFGVTYGVGMVLVFLGIATNIASKNRQKILDKAYKDEAHWLSRLTIFILDDPAPHSNV